MKSVKNILFLTALLTYMVMITGFIGSREQQTKISTLKIRITDSTDNQFIHTDEIRRMMHQKAFNPFGKPAAAIDLSAIEKSLHARQIIRQADAYITEPGILHVDIRQKTPFLRISNRLGQGYYLDREGNIIPLSGNFSPFVIVANGYISESFRIGQTLNIFEVKHDSLPAAQRTIYDVYRLARYIDGDSFWKAQIEQIYVNNRNEVEMIPRVGSHIIELGRVENLDEKFGNLKLLYLEGFNKLGWNQYERISLRYKNQVVCTKIQ